jgi:hypothetical protein
MARHCRGLARDRGRSIRHTEGLSENLCATVPASPPIASDCLVPSGLGFRVADNCVKPESLGRPERERLVQVFRQIDRWRQHLVADYFPGLG